MSEETNIDPSQQQANPSAEPPFNPVGELVRFAETLIDQGDYTSAISCLQEAQGRQPENQYILAVMGRAEALRTGAVTPCGPTSPGALGVTIGASSTAPAKTIGADSSADTEARVRRLTIVASRLFDRGAFDAAFESLMKAYLLDPSSQHVIACEQRLMPVWDLLRKRNAAVATTGRKQENLADGRTLHPKIPRTNDPVPPPVQAVPTPESDLQSQRLRVLEQQREEQRRKHEQTVWRSASQPLKVLGTTAPPKPAGSRGQSVSSPTPSSTPHLRDLSKYEPIGLLKWFKGR